MPFCSICSSTAFAWMIETFSTIYALLFIDSKCRHESAWYCTWHLCELKRISASVQFIASMLGSMGVQGAVQVMHANIPMEFSGA